MGGSATRPVTVFVSQVYPPDPASVGQHVAGAAVEFVRRGHRVVVYTSNRGYDNPTIRYPSRDVQDGVEIRRIPFSSFGKDSILARSIGGMSFVLQAALRMLSMPTLGTIVVSTAPPMSPLAALVVRLFRRIRIGYWVMDLHPDQAIAIGAVAPSSIMARLLEWLNRAILKRADAVVVLDRFMRDRVLAKLPTAAGRLVVIPPWPLEDVAPRLGQDDNPFRREHGLVDRFVVMYSGNHTPSNPLATLLEAAKRLKSDPRLLFLFVGGGVGKPAIDRLEQPNIRSLPYQPLDRLRYSLSAADVHVVTIGDRVIGMVHPCKVYGALAVGRPILLFGPPENHVADLLRKERIGWQVHHGDVEAAVETLQSIVACPTDELEAMGRRAQEVIQGELSRQRLTSAFCDAVG